MNGKGERGRPGHGGDCFCIDEIWGYEDATRPRRELLCIRGVLTFPAGPTVIIHTHTHTAPHAGNVTQNRHGGEAA